MFVMQFTNALIPVTAMEMFKTALKRFVDVMTLPLFILLLIRMYRLTGGHGIVSKLTALDKTDKGRGGAKEVAHSVLAAAGFSKNCMFHPSGAANSGSDNWNYHTYDNTAATGLKYDFGHNGITSENYSLTYCFDVSCEAAPAGQGSVD
jgi:hypothetical protein